MRTVEFLAVTLGFALLSAPVSAASLAPGADPAPAPSQSAPGNISVTPPAAPAAAQVLADRNGNHLSDGLETVLASKGGGEQVDVIVTFSGAGNAATAQQAVGPFAVYRQFRLISGFAATMTANQARALANAPGVFRVEADAIAHATLEGARRDFGVDALLDPADPAIQLPSGAGVRVCVLDTGVQGTHEEFTFDSNLDDNEPPVSRVVGFTDLVGDYEGVFWQGAANAYDDHGHGTHVSGIIAGDGTFSTGEPGADPELAPLARGVAPGADLLVAKVLNYNGSGPDSGIIEGLQWCLDNNADVANLSLGIAGNSDGQDAFSQAVNAAVDLGLPVVVAAGNSGDGESTIGAPGAAERAITVAAVAEYSPSTLVGQSVDPTSYGIYPAPFSSRGPTADGRIKPDIAAPGVTITSAMTNVIAFDDLFSGTVSIVDLGCGVGCYAIKSGTSMASPFTAGAVALMLAVSPGSSPDEIRQILADTAEDRGPLGKDTVFGHGLIDVAAAVSAARQDLSGLETTYPHRAFLRSSVPDNSVVQFPIAVVDMAKPLAITIAIDGKLTSFGWSPDLDVTLQDESGNPYLVVNPLYPWIGEEYMAAPGTTSTCPAGEDCGAIGIQETIHLNPLGTPWAPRFIIAVNTWDGFPNNGKGGSFSIELSNANFESEPPPAPPPALPAAPTNVSAAQGGTDGTALIKWNDESANEDGFEVERQTKHKKRDAWNATTLVATTNANEISVTDASGAGTFRYHVRAINGAGASAWSAWVEVTITAGPDGGSGGGGGGKGGGGGGGGKPCNPKKETCP